MILIAKLKNALVLFLLFIAITGLIYPLLVTGLAEVIFPAQANGSLIERQGKIIGSTLIGQQFDSPQYFWGRPSATSAGPYDALHSGGSNWGPLNPELLSRVKSRVAHLQKSDPSNPNKIPLDLVTASGSGLDPDISPEAAYFQVARLSKTLKIPENDLRRLISETTRHRFLGLLGEPRVNVLELNLALDKMRGSHE